MFLRKNANELLKITEPGNMRHLFCCLILLIPMMLACSSTPRKITLSREIMNNFCEEMKTQNNLIMTGIGQGNLSAEHLKSFCLSFTTVKYVNLEQARKLFVSACEQLLAKVNKDEQIRPCLSNFPFTGNNIEIMLSFKDEYGERVSPPSIAFVFVSKGIVYYSNYDNEKFIDVFNETYEEALKIYQEQYRNFQNCSDNNSNTTNLDP